MAPVGRSTWVAEVAIDEPVGSNLAMWSVGRITDSAQVDGLCLCCLPLSEMAAWLDRRSVGDWRFVRRERVLGRVSLEYRSFQFKQLADARFFAAAWFAEILQLRLISIEIQIAETGFLSGQETDQERMMHLRESRLSRTCLDEAIVWLIDVWPLRRRARALERLRRRPMHRQLRELVTIGGHGGDR